jgi:phosphatidylethanolamine-binding protein (PEBP) family uncharacterized protein
MAGIELRSPSFGDLQPIPARHAKDHDNLSPALEWSKVPPVGDDPHQYFFRVYAVSAPLGLVAGASADDLRRALEGKELASGTLVGSYQR